jgi:hypothetical protein
MADLKEVSWDLIHEDEIWTDEPEPRFVASTANLDYPSNSSLGQYIVDLHNAQIEKAVNSIGTFDYEKMVAELREGA